MSSPSLLLENGLNIREVVTTGSILQINQEFDDAENISDHNESHLKPIDLFGEPVDDFSTFIKTLLAVDEHGYVKKKVLEAGGGLPLHEGCTVSFAYSCYFEKQPAPYDVVLTDKPMVEDLNDNGLLPGLQIAIKSMLVGETSVFLLSYKVMYGELGIPPRIKPKADCVVYIKLLKSILTPKDSKINFSEPNMFERVYHEVKLLYASGSTLYKINNFVGTIQLFKKGINMLHKCRLANEQEEQKQEKMLIKLYINLVICCNKANKPLLACTACNELNRLKSLYNNSKVLFQNAKALRMIGEYDAAEKKLLRAMKISEDNDLMKAEYALLKSLQQTKKQTKAAAGQVKDLVKSAIELVSEEFKVEIDKLIKNFKSSNSEDELLLPLNLNSDEMDYVKSACIRENLFCKKLETDDMDKRDDSNGFGENLKLDNNMNLKISKT